MSHMFYWGCSWIRIHAHTFNESDGSTNCELWNHKNKSSWPHCTCSTSGHPTMSLGQQACRLLQVYFGRDEELWSWEHAADLCVLVLHRCLCCRRWWANRAKLPCDDSSLTLAPLVRQRISASSMTLRFLSLKPFYATFFDQKHVNPKQEVFFFFMFLRGF